MWWWMAAAEKRRKTSWVRCNCGDAHKLVRGVLLDIVPCPKADPSFIMVYRPKW